jgi:hypothetical protein
MAGPRPFATFTVPFTNVKDPQTAFSPETIPAPSRLATEKIAPTAPINVKFEKPVHESAESQGDSSAIVFTPAKTIDTVLETKVNASSLDHVCVIETPSSARLTLEFVISTPFVVELPVIETKRVLTALCPAQVTALFRMLTGPAPISQDS